MKANPLLVSLAEESFNALVASESDCAISLLDPTGNVASWNPGATRITGYSEREIIGQDYAIFFTPADRAMDMPAVALRTARVDGGFQSEHWQSRKDGSRFWASVVLTALKGAEGEVRGYLNVARDLTQRRNASDRLRTSEERFHAFMATSPSVMFIKDRAGRYLYVNDKFLDRFNLHRDQVLGREDVELFASEQAQRFAENDARVFALRTAIEFEETAHYIDGEYISAVSKFPLHDADGNIVAIGGIATDITERKRAEDALRTSEQTIRELVDALPAGVYVCNAAGLIESYNHRAVELWGREPRCRDNAELFCGSLRAYTLDGTPLPHSESPLAEVLRNGMAVADRELVIERPDGSRRTIIANVVPRRDSQGNLTGAINCMTDITERRQAEDALQENQRLLHLVLATLPVGVAVTNRAGDIVLSNATAKQIWGGDEVIASGRERWARSKGYWHDSGKAIAPTDWASVRALSRGETSLTELIDIDTFDGDKKTIQNYSAPIRNAHQQIVGAVIVNEDVTERLRAEKALRESRNRLRRLSQRLLRVQEEERRHLARELHDEFGQLLAAVALHLHGAKMTAGVAAQSSLDECLVLIQRAGEQVRGLALELRPTMLETAGLDGTLRWFARQHQQRTGIATEVEGHLGDVSSELGIACFRVIQEALTNVVRHAGAKHVLIDLSRSASALELAISDDGAGFDVKSIFEQAAAHGRLGLAGMKERVQILGGRMVVDSGSGRGTRISVSLPLSIPVSEPA
jgi:PAS domain S-box-containing protein